MVTTFDISNAVGKVAERVVAEAFLAAGWWVQMRHHGARRDLAVMRDNRIELVEVKNEERFARSGNFCVELYQGFPSRVAGVLTSESSVYVHYFGDTSLVFRTQAFRLFLDVYMRQHPWREFPGADNGNGGLIIPRKEVTAFPWATETPTQQLPDAVASITDCPAVPPHLNR
jgi:hypothetical protein